VQICTDFTLPQPTPKETMVGMWIKNSSLKVAVLFFENTTTHVMHLEEGDKTNSAKFEVSQILEGQLKLRLPKVACVMGHQVDLVVMAYTKDNEWQFRSRAKILGHEALDGTQEAEVLLDLHNKSDIDYTRFLELFKGRQDEISELFRAIKGK
jgi:hypothetical protein